MEKFHSQITPQSNNMSADLVMQAPAIRVSTDDGPVVPQSSAQDRDPDDNQEMVMRQNTYSQYVTESLQ
jgi:hypothetical protein